MFINNAAIKDPTIRNTIHEVLIDVLDELREGFAFGENLVFRAEDVAVVLGEAANTHHAVERAGGFVAVALAEFAEAERQITVAAQRAVEDLDVARRKSGFSLHRDEFYALQRVLSGRYFSRLRPFCQIEGQALVNSFT